MFLFSCALLITAYHTYESEDVGAIIAGKKRLYDAKSGVTLEDSENLPTI